MAFFNGVGIRVLTNRLPFDPIQSAQAHNNEMQLIKDVLTVFGGGFRGCVRVVIRFFFAIAEAKVHSTCARSCVGSGLRLF